MNNSTTIEALKKALAENELLCGASFPVRSVEGEPFNVYFLDTAGNRPAHAEKVEAFNAFLEEEGAEILSGTGLEVRAPYVNAKAFPVQPAA